MKYKRGNWYLFLRSSVQDSGAFLLRIRKNIQYCIITLENDSERSSFYL